METEKKNRLGSVARAAFEEAWKVTQASAFATALDKGWLPMDKEPNHAEQVCLMHAELSEACEYLRIDKAAPSEKIPEFTGLEEELADVIIRIMSYSGRTGLNVAGAIIRKMDYNMERDYKHGGKKF